MKYKQIFCWVVVVCCAGLVSCSDERETSTSGMKPGNMRIVGTVSGFTSLPATRTQTGNMTDEGALMMKWSVGDCIGVFGANTANALFTSDNEEPAEQVTFSGAIDSGDTPLYAYYPYQEGMTDRKNISVTLPAEQIYIDESSIAQYDVKAANIILPSGNGSYTLNMRQMAALVRFEINLADAGGFSVDEKLIRAELHTGDHVTGNYSYDLTNLDAGLLPAGGEQSSTLNLTFAECPSLSEPVIAYAVVAPGSQAGKTWNCTFITDKHRIDFTTDALCDFESGKYYIMPLNATVLENNHADVTEQEETANCYMITGPGEHSFQANVMGNGQKGIIPGQGFHAVSAYFTPVSAKLLWQDTEGFIDESSVRLRDGRCYYTARKNTGNAVIAVYDGEDCTGDILWSWHIWGVGDEIPSDEMYTNKAGAQFTVMDRTLGAHSKTSVYATLYQWGRKDPFPNVSVYYVDGMNENIEESFPMYISTEGTIAESVKHPAEMQKYVDNSYRNWLAEDNVSLWGDTKGSRGNLTDISNAGAGWTNGKTIYDPSPAGYRVANKYTWTYFVKRSDGTTGSLSNPTKLDYINYVKYDNGYYFMKSEDDTEGAFYPMVGLRYGSDGSMMSAGASPENTVGCYTYYWSSAPFTVINTDGGYSSALYLGRYDAKTGGSNSRNTVTVVESVGRRDAYAVRCVRE